MNIKYQKFLNESMLEFVKKILTRIQSENLYWDQLIYISYRTDNPLVVLPLKVKQLYPKEITIVLQHQFENLLVKDEGFSLTVSFDGIKEAIYIPFNSLISFVDSSNNYSLTFNQQLNSYNNSQNEILKIKKQLLEERNKDDDETNLSPNVIILDKFRNSSKAKPSKPK
ncbi:MULTISPECIES: ClpXP protease specificity-enhancing factor SspB [unclassified Rickettsia]|uniref:ClpXP protease specificity-enhancing factor SspB n=1 Tax=unclassified Rickettsia TaxID=114295 RepID=UPI00209D320D|nr:ClpXP protease specificity-enhancing factor SspB [Rickettsia endosymbiont of Ceutorhynchus assimilis]